MQLYPVTVIKKAQKVEQFLHRIEQGEILEEACSNMGLEITTAKLERLQAKYKAGDRTWEVLVDGRYGREQKINGEIKEWIQEQKRQDIMLTARKLAERVNAQFGVELSVDYLRYWLRKEGLSRPQGRPSNLHPVIEQEQIEPSEEVVDNVGIFLLEGAKQEMDVEDVVLKTISEACQENQESSMRITKSAESTILCKFDHLLYLPILGLKRPRCLYYYQGDGLRCLHGRTYKYMPLEQFLGELTHLKIGYPMASALAACYSQKVYPGDDPLFIYVDWHSKPHWTKHYYHSGHVTMWHRIMPGTKQLMVNGPHGWILIGLNDQIDNHFSNVLVDLEDDLVTILKRPIAYTIVDGEAGGAPLGERYTGAERHYISVISGYYSLQNFETVNQWQPVTNDPAHEVIFATWADPKKKEEECRQLVLMRPVDKIDPTRVYTGNIPDDMAIVDIPYQFRKRWADQERRFREMIAAANLNVNYGYLYNKVTNRTRQREQAEAMQKLETTQSKLSHKQEVLNNLQLKSAQLKVVYTEKSSQLHKGN